MNWVLERALRRANENRRKPGLPSERDVTRAARLAGVPVDELRAYMTERGYKEAS